MKKFDKEKFSRDLIALRGNRSQSAFAEELEINRSTLSLLENGKQVPAMDIFSKICSLMGCSTDCYFFSTSDDGLVYLMGSLNEEDKENVRKMADRIRIKEKYELLAERCRNARN